MTKLNKKITRSYAGKKREFDEFDHLYRSK